MLVLLSSYNGERYIREQLDSLLRQTIPVDILIRDDGSTDQTVGIIREYMDAYPNIRLIEGNHLGFVRSFTALVCEKTTDDYEWLAFCDQDDIWLPEKMEKAVCQLSVSYRPEIPTLYYEATGDGSASPSYPSPFRTN